MEEKFIDAKWIFDNGDVDILKYFVQRYGKFSMLVSTVYEDLSTESKDRFRTLLKSKFPECFEEKTYHVGQRFQIANYELTLHGCNNKVIFVYGDRSLWNNELVEVGCQENITQSELERIANRPASEIKLIEEE